MQDPIKIWQGSTKGQVKTWPKTSEEDGPSIQSGDTLTKTFTTGENINAGMAVYMETDGKVYIYNSNDTVNEGKFIGLAHDSVLIGDIITIIISGILNNVGSGYVEGDVYYASTTGFPSTTVPSSGFQHEIGIGIDSDNLLVVNGIYIELI